MLNLDDFVPFLLPSLNLSSGGFTRSEKDCKDGVLVTAKLGFVGLVSPSCCTSPDKLLGVNMLSSDVTSSCSGVQRKGEERDMSSF